MDGNQVETSVVQQQEPMAAGGAAAADNISNSGGSSNNEPAEPQAKPTFAIHTDPRTGRRTVISIAEEQEQPASGTQQQPSNQQQVNGQQQPPAPIGVTPPAQQQPIEQKPLFGNNNTPPQPYNNAAELIQAIQQGTVDERRIPIEHAIAYADFKQKQQQAHQQAAAAQVQPPKEAAVPPQVNRNEFYGRIDALAKESAMKELGLTKELIETAEYSDDKELAGRVSQYETAVMFHRNAIMQRIGEQQRQAAAAQVAQKQVIDAIASKVAEYQRTEPNFQQINMLMENYYTQLPYEEGKKYADVVQALKNKTITEEQAATLQEYYEKARIKFYADKNGLKTVPQAMPGVPRVEKAGNTNGFSNTNNVTKEQLRNAGDYRTRRELIGRILSNNR